MKRVLFVTGTDTGVGKTIATAVLLRALRAQGIRAASMKPVQTGALRQRDAWRAPDLDLHLAASGLAVDAGTYRLMAPFCYEPACSPHLAGRLAGSYPDIPRILHCATTLLESFDALLVEGAGGLLAPLDESLSMLDLVRAFDAPVVVVARTGLGTINHSLLTLGALSQAHADVAGVLFSQSESGGDAAIETDNPNAVCQRSGIRHLGTLRHYPEPHWDDWCAELTGLPALRALL